MSKVTHKIDVVEIPLTLDRYGDRLDWLNIAEAVFPGPTAAEAFTPPPWFKRELNDRPACGYGNMAKAYDKSVGVTRKHSRRVKCEN